MIIREKVRIGDQLVTLETGRIAKQAGGSCLVRAGDTIVLVTVCGNQDAKPGQSFFPLSVDYQEKTYAAGKIPGGFFKREGKLRDYEVLTSRLIDRPCRPLFPEGYLAEVQVVATVMSFDGENPPDVLAMIGASAALHTSPIPWKGPIAGVRVGRVDGEWIANPTFKQMAESDCELLVAASRDAIVMVEGEAEEINEDDMVEALLFGHRAVQSTLDLIDRMQQAVGKTKWSFDAPSLPQILRDRVRQVSAYKLRDACNVPVKHERYAAFKVVKKDMLEVLGPEFPDQIDGLKTAFEDLKYTIMRTQVLEDGRRIDGRDTRTVRPISIELGVLPRVHGSSLFTRGETQAIVTTTLGTSRDAQRIDTLAGDEHKLFMLHYNFPPYSVGEVKPMRGPGRREVGHGNLAERALTRVLPKKEDFPYSIRIVSEITESNGSSSMASVCGGSLALMDAGVPIRAPVAGVAMGLIKEGDDYAVLTDILGDEDALGDMDFKVCGTEAGITAIQMDIKIDGLSREILERALHQARESRLHILGKMAASIEEPREELSRWAPRITSIRVKPDQVRTIIGPGGKMIRAIVDQTGASIDVEDDGTVNVASADSEAVKKALEIIKSLTTEPEIGEVYEGTVKRIEPYGAFIEVLPGKDGLCHISDLDWSHVNSVEDYLALGDKVSVKITNIDRDGRIRLSRKDAMPEPGGGKLNGRSADEKPAMRGRDRDERPRGREDRPREDRGGFKGAGREERGPGRGREERPAFKPREEREERPAFKPREDREERPAFKAREEREERPAFKPREDREERPAFKPREDREERSSFKPREDREERPAFKAREEREERPAFKPREDREERPAFKAREDREDRFKPRGEEREERPAFKAREEREDRFKPRGEEREDRFKPRGEEREERPAFKAREEREDRFKPRGEEREDRFKPRDLAAPKGRDEERPAFKAREEREDRFKPREDKPRDDAFRGRERDAERPARGRDDRDEPRSVRARDEDVRPARDLGFEKPRDERKPARDDERSFAKPREERKPLRDDRDERKPVRDEREDRFAKPRDEKPRLRDEERGPVKAREDKPRVRDEEPVRGRDRDVRREPEREDRPTTRAREPRRDEEPRGPRGRDDAPRGRDDAQRGRDDAPRGRRDELEDRPARGRDRFEDDRSRESESVERKPVRRPLDEERPVLSRARDDRDEDQDERGVTASANREREDRTERERPSRTRTRARTRERVREVERERERR